MSDTQQQPEMEPEFNFAGGFRIPNPRFGLPLQPVESPPSIQAPPGSGEVDNGDCDACDKRPSVQGQP